MDLLELKNKICDAFSGTQEEFDRVLTTIEEDKAIFPFNEFELKLSSLFCSVSPIIDSLSQCAAATAAACCW